LELAGVEEPGATALDWDCIGAVAAGVVGVVDVVVVKLTNWARGAAAPPTLNLAGVATAPPPNAPEAPVVALPEPEAEPDPPVEPSAALTPLTRRDPGRKTIWPSVTWPVWA
jgi:hypothetical protein